MNASVSPLQGIGMTSLRTRQRLVQSLRKAGVHNEAVLEVMLNTPRHLFVEEALASRAYENTALPIGFGQTISQPYVVALMTQALLSGINPHKILEVGTGSAYQTAVLAALVGRVYSVERIGWLLERARQRLRMLAIHNVRLKYGDGHLGWPDNGPYDGIMVTAACREIPITLVAQLSIGGHLVIPVGPPSAQQLLRLVRKRDGFTSCVLSAANFVPLLGGVL